jgi:DNA-binding HxlR family transcriptional regulator
MAGRLCAITESIKVIGTKPRLLIIRHLSLHQHKFNLLKKHTKLSSRTLALNLKYLQGKRIVLLDEEKNYQLTNSGLDLIPVLEQAGIWAERWRIHEH